MPECKNCVYYVPTGAKYICLNPENVQGGFICL